MARSSRAAFRMESLDKIESDVAKVIVASIEAQTAEIQSLLDILDTILLELRRIRIGTSIIADNDLEQYSSES